MRCAIQQGQRESAIDTTDTFVAHRWVDREIAHASQASHASDTDFARSNLFRWSHRSGLHAASSSVGSSWVSVSWTPLPIIHCMGQARQSRLQCREYQHFKPRSNFGGYEGLASRRTLTWASFAAGGSFVIWLTTREEIPYTGRMHCILVPTSIEQSIGESTFKQVIIPASLQLLLCKHDTFLLIICHNTHQLGYHT